VPAPTLHKTSPVWAKGLPFLPFLATHIRPSSSLESWVTAACSLTLPGRRQCIWHCPCGRGTACNRVCALRWPNYCSGSRELSSVRCVFCSRASSSGPCHWQLSLHASHVVPQVGHLCALLCPVVPCCALLCPVVPCCALLCPVVPCRGLLCPVVPCRALLCPVVPCCALVCPVLRGLLPSWSSSHTTPQGWYRASLWTTASPRASFFPSTTKLWRVTSRLLVLARVCRWVGINNRVRFSCDAR
jgi:hypothetical protein